MNLTFIENDRSLNTIFQEKMTLLRIEASHLFLKKIFSATAYEDLVEKIKKTATLFPELKPEVLQTQLVLAHQAFEKGSVKGIIQLNHPLLQFVWGMALMRIASHPEQMVKWPLENQSQNGVINSVIWEQLKETPEMQKELESFTVMLASRGFVKDTVRIRWGGSSYPGVGYYFSPKEHLVNLDVLWALTGGFEHMRAAVFHELAHASGTVEFSPKIRQARDRIQTLSEKNNRTEPETQELIQLMAEDQMRYLIFDEAENSFANGFGKMITQKELYHQDLAYSLNALETSLFGLGYKVQQNTRKDNNHKSIVEKAKSILLTPEGISTDENKEDENKKTPLNELINLKNVIRYAFFTNNGLFENKIEEWEKIGIHYEWIQGKDKNGLLLTGQAAIDELVRISAELESLQIPVAITSSRLSIQEKIQQASLARGEIIDDLYERFAKEIVERMREEEKQKMNQNMRQNSNSSSGSSSQKSQGEKNQQSQQENTSSSENGKDQSSQPNGGSSSQGEKNQQSQQENTSSSEKGKDQSSQPNRGSSSQGEKNQQSQQESTSSSENGKDQSSQQEGNNSSSQKRNQGKEKKYEMISPQEERIQRRKANDSDEGKEIKSILEKINQNSSQNTHNQQMSQVIDKLITSEENSQFKEPVYKKETHLYNQIIAKHSGVLKKLKELFGQLRNIYLDDNHTKNRELLPQGSLEGSLDINSVINRFQKIQSGQKIDVDDYKHFNNPVAPSVKKAPIDICVFIDISDSVEKAGKSKFAIEIGCLINEAVKNNDCFNFYLGVMTRPVHYLAEPGMNEKEIAGRLNTLYNGNHWSAAGDKIEDATRETLKRIQARTPTNEKEGFSHFFYITDGAHTDGTLARPLLNQLMDHSRVTTFNWLAFPCNWTNDDILSKLEKDRAGKTGTRGLMKVRINEKEDILPAFSKLLQTRIREMKRTAALETAFKKRMLTEVLNKLGK